MNKNQQQLESFTKYCQEHPEQRFWQALRNWAEVAFILKADYESDPQKMFEGQLWTNQRDTFHEEHQKQTEQEDIGTPTE